MIRAYHVIWGTYGFWLPNDPRGSWSEFVASWELLHHGKSTAIAPREARSDEWASWQAAALKSLRHLAIELTGVQARAIGVGFGNAVRRSKFIVLACSLFAETRSFGRGSTHFRHRASVHSAKRRGNEATQSRRSASSRDPCPRRQGTVALWKVFLEDDANIQATINYVEQNPIKEGKRAQGWSFVTPFY